MFPGAEQLAKSSHPHRGFSKKRPVAFASRPRRGCPASKLKFIKAQIKKRKERKNVADEMTSWQVHVVINAFVLNLLDLLEDLLRASQSSKSGV